MNSGARGLTLEKIARELCVAYRGGRSAILEKAEAEQRARWIFDDLKKVGFELVLELWRAVDPRHGIDLWVPGYRLRNTGFSTDVPAREATGYCASGPGLGSGDLLKLSRACKIGHELLLEVKWPQTYTKRLRNEPEHHNVIEEVLWLGRFRTPRRVRKSVKLVPGSESDVDFSFECESCRINFQAKYRPSTWINGLRADFSLDEIRSLFNDFDPRKQFQTPKDDEFNLVGITTLAPITDAVRAFTEHFIEGTAVSGVFFWTDHAPAGRQLEFVSSRTRLPEMFVAVAEEEQVRIAPFRFQVLDPETGKPMLPKDVPKVLGDILRGE